MGIETAIGAISAATGLVGSLTGGGSKAKQMGGVPADVQPLRRALVDWIMGGGQQPNPMFGKLGAALGVNPASTAQGMFGKILTPGVDQIDNSFFFNHLMKPYQEMFAAQNDRTLAQAKESAGNLTGSSFNNILGSSAASAEATQNEQLAQLYNQGVQQEMAHNQANAGNILQLLLGLSTGGVSSGQVMSQPGWADTAAQTLATLGPQLGKWFAPQAQPQLPNYNNPISARGPYVVPIGGG